MGNSPLVSYTKLSPCNSGQRTMAIDRITPHCIVGQLSVETIGACFDHISEQASCNYGIGVDGRVMLCVPENQRSWCSSSSANDQRAVTIECASDKTHPYAINNTVYNKLIDLCTDICRRNGKNVLLWFGDKTKTLEYQPRANEMIITVHRWFAPKACPGDYIYNRLGEIATEVTRRLAGENVDIKYKVRLTWDDEKSQKGAFINFDKAVECANANPGYSVFTKKGKIKYTSKSPSSINEIILKQNKNTNNAILATLPDYKGLPNTKEDYLNKVAEIAVKLYAYTHILPSVVISQCCLENGFGCGQDAIELTVRNNLVGQKASLLNNTWQDYTVWDGTSFNKRTPEVYNGVPTTIIDAFRIFPNYATSILDYEMFLTHVKINSTQYKYRDVVGMTDPYEMITIISKRGYATGLTYISSVMRIINEYDLTKYDKQAIAALSNTSSDTSSTSQKPSSAASTQDINTTSKVAKKTLYRVQTGVYESHDKAAKQIDKILKKTKLESFMEQDTNGDYHVYCGSFSQLAKAEERVALLQSKKIDAIIKEG